MARRWRRSVGLLACVLLAARAEAHGIQDLKQSKEPSGTTESTESSDLDQPDAASADATKAQRLQDVEEVIVTGRKQPLTAASSAEINMRDYLLRPHSTTQEIMNNVPGLLVVQHQGG